MSAYTKDHEGSTLFGTFGHGIIVIPNLDVTNYSPESNQSQITKITKTNDGEIILGNQLGEVQMINKNNTIKKFETKSNQRIEILEYF